MMFRIDFKTNLFYMRKSAQRGIYWRGTRLVYLICVDITDNNENNVPYSFKLIENFLSTVFATQRKSILLKYNVCACSTVNTL